MHKKMLVCQRQGASGHGKTSFRPRVETPPLRPLLRDPSGEGSPTMPTGTVFSAVFTCTISARPSTGNLISAEKEIETWEGRRNSGLRHEILDLDKDLQPEIWVATAGLVRLDQTGLRRGPDRIGLPARRKFNLTNALTRRRPEAYHRKLKTTQGNSLPAGTWPLPNFSPGSTEAWPRP